MLDFYAARSPIFLAAVFDADAAADARPGASATARRSTSRSRPTIPWVPLRILALGKGAAERVEADVYLLTDRTPALLPAPTGANGLELGHSAPASESLLDDLRSDRGHGAGSRSSGWLTKVRIDAAAPQLAFDLAIDASGARAAVAGDGRPGPAGCVVPAVDRTADFVRILVAIDVHGRSASAGSCSCSRAARR